MGITYQTDMNGVDQKELNQLYGNTHDKYALFEKSYLKVIALDGGRIAGAARVISEGLETALLVDLAIRPEYEKEVAKQLVETLEAKLIDRRVMVYSNREYLEILEELGYGRCKNAWTYFKPELEETDFLPAGYKYENEFLSYSTKTVNEPKTTEITYKTGYEDASYEAINELLTKAFFGRPHELNKTKAIFENSGYAVTAYDGAQLVGIARAVTDGQDYATILNVAVNPEYQGLSIGKKVVLRLSELVPADVIVLNTHPGAVGFYNRLKEYRRNKYVFEKHITQGEQRQMPPERRAAMFTPKGYRFPEEYK